VSQFIVLISLPRYVSLWFPFFCHNFSRLFLVWASLLKVGISRAEARLPDLRRREPQLSKHSSVASLRRRAYFRRSWYRFWPSSSFFASFCIPLSELRNFSRRVRLEGRLMFLSAPWQSCRRRSNYC
ncbi:hypothetical protein CSUI_011081, partial [Cystoisospora suis]